MRLDVSLWPAVHDDLCAGRSVTIVVDGELVCTGAHDCDAPTHLLGCYRSTANDSEHGGRVPPAVFRALPETCETCDGTGQYVDDRGEVYEDACPSDDCVGGVPLVEFVARCPKCDGFGGYIVSDGMDELRHGTCRTCGAGSEGGGRVRLGRGTVQLARVVAKPSDTDERPVACPGTASTGQAFVHVFWKPSTVLDHHSQVIPLDATEPKVGQFVAVLTPETTP